MGLFSREERMNKEGKFVVVKRGLFGRRESSTPEYDRLHNQAKKEKREQRIARKREYREAFEKARHEAKLKRMYQAGTRAGSLSMSDRFNNLASGFDMKHSTRNNYNPWGSMFDTGMNISRKSSSSGKKYVIRGGKAYPIAGKKKKKVTKKSVGGFDMMDNWGFMK